MRIAFDRCVRAGFPNLRQIQSIQTSNPFKTVMTEVPLKIVDGAHDVCQTLLSDMVRFSFIGEQDYETEWVCRIFAIHRDTSVQIKL